MQGTIVNVIAIIIGSLIGILLKKGLSENYEKALHKALGIAVTITGLNGAITSMISVQGEKLVSSGELMVIISLVVGTVIGEKLRIDDRLNNISNIVEKRFNLSGFARSFVNSTLLFGVGAMSIIGAFNDGARGDSSILYIKSLLDGIASIVFSATLGIGVIFSTIPLFIYQGSLSLAANALEPLIAGNLLNEICMVGYCLVICIGYNFLSESKIKTANLLPSLLVPIAWHAINFLFA